MRSWTPERMQTLRDLRTAGASHGAVGEKMRISEQAARAQSRRMGLAGDLRVVAQEIKEQIAEYLRGGGGVKGAATKFNVSAGTARTVRDAIGIAPRSGAFAPYIPYHAECPTITLPPLASLANMPPIIDFHRTSAPQSATIFQYTNRACCWPLGEPRTKSFRFCEALTDGTYCTEHYAMAYLPKRTGAFKFHRGAA